MYWSRLLGGAAIAWSALASMAAANPQDADAALYSVRGGVLFVHDAQQKSLLVAGAQSDKWEPLRDAFGTQLAVQDVAAADDAVWAVADGALWRLASDRENVSASLPVGWAHDSLRLSPTRPECVLANGKDGAVLGCLEWDMSNPLLRSVDGVRSCEFLSNDSSALDYVCVQTAREAALQLNSANEAPQTITIDGDALTHVDQLVRTPSAIVAVVRDKAALKLATYSFDAAAWRWAALPAARASTQLSIVQDPQALLVIADAGPHRRELWTANSDASLFSKRADLDAKASVKRIGRALYAQDERSRIIVSKDNGRSWSADVGVELDLASVRTSDRWNVGFNPDHSKIAVSHDGLEWKMKQLYVLDAGTDGLELFDYGSAIMVWSAEFSRADWSLDGGCSWLANYLPSDFAKAEDVRAFAYGPRIFFLTRSRHASEIRTMDLTRRMGDRACENSDLELVQDSECVMGARESTYIRRLGKTFDYENCIMGPAENHPPPTAQACPCTMSDFECDTMFEPSDGLSCTPGSELLAKLSQCTAGEHQYVSKGYRRLRGDRCAGGQDLSGMTYHDCDAGEIMAAGSQPSVVSTMKEFDGQFSDYLYLPSTKSAETDETVLVYTMAGDLFVSQDQGGEWQQVPQIKNILSLFKSDTPANQVYIFTSDSVERQSIWVSWDRGRNFEEIYLPAPPGVIYGILPHVVAFHPKHPEWMLYTGTDRDCRTVFDCPGVSYLSKDKGRSWQKVHGGTSTCQWVNGLVYPTDENLMYCFLQSDSDSLDYDFVYSEDYFVSDNHTVPGLERVLATAMDKPFVVAAHYESGVGEVNGFVSLNGKDFAAMRFPPNVKFDKESGFTLISTETQSILMFATANSKMMHEFGVLLKSNSNGTDFAVALENVNRGAGLFGAFVDFERVKSIEGVALANVVANVDDVVRKGESKKLQTRITHSDGSMWASLEAPKGMCNGVANCNLHLHGYTERLDPRNTPSSPSAIGLIVARGNVGEYLGEMRSAQTFMSRDGGLTWMKVHDRPMFWEFGDSGSIVVLIDSQESTNTLYYTLDEGETWTEFQFSDVAIEVVNIATIPSDSSRKFVIFGRPPLAYGDKTLAFQIDFSGITDKQCGETDYELWTPLHPQSKSPCLFGHEAKYQRKIRGRACFVGKSFSETDGTVRKPPVDIKNCECQRSDYECDYNYKLNPSEGTCELEPGLQPPTREQQCQSGAVSWHKITGYRKIPISTCEGGQKLSDDDEYPCPGMEDEFNRQRGRNPKSPSKGASHFRKFIGAVLILVIGAIVVCGLMWTSSRGYTALPAVHLPESFDSRATLSTSAQTSMDFIERAWAQATELVALVASRIPLVGPRSPRDHMGFYSRMDDDERYRTFDSDDFEDDESVENEEREPSLSSEPDHLDA